MLAEVQLHLGSVLQAKGLGHKHYEVKRDLHARYGSDTGPHDHWHADDVAAYHNAHDSMKKIYANAWEKASGKIKKIDKTS
jgi:hypothetical protein